RGYWHAEIWARSTEGDEWWATLAELGCAVPLAAHEEPQGEAIGFSVDGMGYFSISEGIQPSLHFYHALPRT
ncbi:PE family protein, partial [Candidatus Bipolaricaulota bacterium]|nr:PE family protein [Candidatus Bipolaricaulota bacterium]